MRRITKKIVTDDRNNPAAVQIDYADWLEIEKLLGLNQGKSKPTDLSHWRGTIDLKEDAMELQRRWREEWD